MRIACPACSAEYDVPDTIVAAGRKVRCARCHEVWAAAPPEPATADTHPGPAPDGASAAPADAAVALDPAAAATAAPASAPAAAPVLRAEPRRFDTLPGEEEDSDDEDAPPASRLWIAAWAASLLVLLLGAWAVVHWHAAVIAAWPASVRLFAALGLTGH